MEIWDGYNRDGTLAGIDLVRGEPVPEGLYHLVCEILVRHADGDYLLMRRDPRKPLYPGYEEASAGGSALKGEDPLTCAKRELFEETGIRADSLEPCGVTISHDTLYHTYLCVTGIPKDAVVLQEGETVSYRWADAQAFAAFIRSGDMIPKHKVHFADLFKRLGFEA